MKKRIFSGAQPTGQLHIGNYLGALKNWVDLQYQFDSFFCIVNLHAITLPQDPEVLKQKTLDLARIYLAAGIDPDVSKIFIQSDVSEHAELAWVLSCVSRMGELERMTQFKDKSQNAPQLTREEAKKHKIFDKGSTVDNFLKFTEASYKTHPNLINSKYRVQAILEILRNDSEAEELFFDIYRNLIQKKPANAGVGLFTYPVLMAADILLYKTHLVPVGKDQKQHLELSRTLAERFNRDYAEIFVIPEPYIPEVGANILSLADATKKMSKSDINADGAIFLLDDADTIRKKFKKAVTGPITEITFGDSNPAIKNLLTIYQLITDKTHEECEADFANKSYEYLKTETADAVIEFLRPFQKKAKAYTDEELTKILKNGAQKARRIARKTLRDVYAKMGIVGAG